MCWHMRIVFFRIASGPNFARFRESNAVEYCSETSKRTKLKRVTFHEHFTTSQNARKPYLIAKSGSGVVT